MHQKNRVAYKILVGTRNRRNYLGDSGVDWRPILKLILDKHLLKVLSGLNWLRIGSKSELNKLPGCPSQ
jgi:hypothetical protein